MKTYYLIFIFFLSLSVQLLFSNSISLIVTTNVHGEVDPCG